MQKRSILTAAAAAVLAAGVAACNADSLTNLNNNPNRPSQVRPDLLFTNATTSVVYTIRGTSFEHGLGALWVQHYAEVQYPEADLYNPRGATMDALWSGLYVGGLQDFKQVLTQAGNNVGIAGPTTVMRAWTFQVVTDMWGDVPFTQANRGTGQELLTPAYDRQSVVYDSLLKELKAAATGMQSASGTLGAADPIYGGDLTQWVKFANSLRARLALRLSNVDPERARAELADALAGPVLTSNDDAPRLVYPGDGANNNPLYDNWKTRDDQRLSKTFVDSLARLNDPRLARYADSTTNSTKCATPGCYPAYVGAQNGLTASPGAIPRTSRPNKAIRGAASPSWLMTYAELLFIKAEAAQRGFVAGDAGQLYADAVRASMQQWGVSDADAADYLAQPGVAYDAATGASQIAYQKWIALFNQETEAYSEWRRTGVPSLTPGPNAAFATVPRRLLYRTDEASLNAANLKAAISAQGGADLTNRVYWDRAP